MADQIRFIAYINRNDATGEQQGGTSIYVTVPDSLTRLQQIHYIAGNVAAEVSRYLANECLEALHPHGPSGDH